MVSVICAIILILSRVFSVNSTSLYKREQTQKGVPQINSIYQVFYLFPDQTFIGKIKFGNNSNRL